MSYRFEYQVTPDATELRIRGPRDNLPTDSWSIEAPVVLLSGVDLVQRLIAAEVAIGEDDTVLIEHRAVSGLSAAEAKSLALPPFADVIGHLETTGIITRPDFRIKLSWRRGGGQPIVDAKRTGAWLRVGDGWQRLPDALFEIAEGVDRLNAVPDDDLGDTQRQIAPDDAAGIIIGAETISLTDDEADELRARVENAIGANQKNVHLNVEGRTIDVPALTPIT